MGKPIADKGENCPLWQKDVSKVCHTCKWYTQIRGLNPNTGEPMDRWACAIELMPILQIEVAKETRQGAAATESFRNAVVQSVPRAPSPALLEE